MYTVGLNNRTFGLKTAAERNVPIWRDDDERLYVPCALDKDDPDVSRGTIHFDVKTIRGPSRGIDPHLPRGYIVHLHPAKPLVVLSEADFQAHAERVYEDATAGFTRFPDRAATIARILQRIRELQPRIVHKPKIGFEVLEFFIAQTRAEERERGEIVRPSGSDRPASATYASRNTGIATLAMLRPNWEDVSRVYGTEILSHRAILESLLPPEGFGVAEPPPAPTLFQRARALFAAAPTPAPPVARPETPESVPPETETPEPLEPAAPIPEPAAPAAPPPVKDPLGEEVTRRLEAVSAANARRQADMGVVVTPEERAAAMALTRQWLLERPEEAAAEIARIAASSEAAYLKWKSQQ